MGILMGAALKTVASRLLKSAFTRSTKDVSQENLDQYKDLDKEFKQKELPKPVESAPITPKEQFLNSIGDRGYGLDERDSSLYQRLTEDMKVVIDSNYSVADSLNKKLDYTNESIRTLNENVTSAAEVAATYGKLNQEAIVGSGSKGSGKITSLLSSALEAVKDAVSLAIGGVLKVIGDVATVVGNIAEDVKSLNSTYSGKPGVDPGVDATISKNESWQEELESEIEKGKEEFNQKSEQLAARRASKTWTPDSAPKGYDYNTELAYKIYLGNSELSVDPNLEGAEAFDAFISSFNSDYVKKNYASTGKYYLAYGKNILEESKTMTNEEKSELWNYMKENLELQSEASKVNENILSARAAKKEAKKAETTAYMTRGATTLLENGLLSDILKVSDYERDAWQLSLGATPGELGYSEGPDGSNGEGRMEFASRLRDKASEIKSRIVKEIREGKYFSDEELIEMGFKRKNGEWRSKYSKNDEKLYDKLVEVAEDTLERATGEYDVELNDPLLSGGSSELVRAKVLRGITSGAVIVEKDGKTLDPSKVTMLDEFNSSIFNGYGYNLGPGYTFRDALTKEEIEVTPNYSGMERLAEASDNIINERDRVLRDSLSELGVSSEDEIASMTQSQFDDLYSRFENLIGPGNDLILQMLVQIYANTQKGSGNVIVVPNGSENAVP